MSTSRDFVVSTLADTLLPLFRRSFEDVVYETLDKRAVPTRADFKDLRDLADGLRGQVSGAVNGVGRLADERSKTQTQLDAIVARLDAIDARLDRLSDGQIPVAKKAPTRKAAPRKAAPQKAAPKKRATNTQKKCQVRGCKDSVRSKGFCSRHYQSWRRGRLEGFPLQG